VIKYLNELGKGEEMEHEESYHEFVERLFAKRCDGLDGILHAAIGIAGEGGELLDSVKKTWVYDKPLDEDNLIEELGDLEFYMQALRTRLGVSRQYVLNRNMAKLNLRYPSGYSDKAAQARADKMAEG
jgi:NTP pyrophosphatase (non-canonical NTP hydrolase)